MCQLMLDSIGFQTKYQPHLAAGILEVYGVSLENLDLLNGLLLHFTEADSQHAVF